jgi:hypothetical protein
MKKRFIFLSIVGIGLAFCMTVIGCEDGGANGSKPGDDTGSKAKDESESTDTTESKDTTVNLFAGIWESQTETVQELTFKASTWTIANKGRKEALVLAGAYTQTDDVLTLELQKVNPYLQFGVGTDELLSGEEVLADKAVSADKGVKLAVGALFKEFSKIQVGISSDATFLIYGTSKNDEAYFVKQGLAEAKPSPFLGSWISDDSMFEFQNVSWTLVSNADKTTSVGYYVQGASGATLTRTLIAIGKADYISEEKLVEAPPKGYDEAAIKALFTPFDVTLSGDTLRIGKVEYIKK